MEKVIHVGDAAAIRNIFGVEDKNLRFIENKFGVTVLLKENGLCVRGAKKHVDTVVDFINKILELSKEGLIFNREELAEYLDAAPAPDTEGKEADQKDELAVKVASPRRKFVLPRTDGQRNYIKAMRMHDIVFAIGPAGTGKTYLAMAIAVNHLMEKHVRRIILTRPAIEAGESLGFLPGDMSEKLGPYLRPLYDALYDMMEVDIIDDYLDTGVIEIVPLAYMRGRTLNNAFVILDEAQNCTSDQLKMVLTRLGFDSKIVITGDITQSDLPGRKPMGLIDAVKILEPIQGIEFVTLSKEDVVRHSLIQKIIQAYEDFHSETSD